MLNTGLFNKNEVIAVALSGGKDSVCLLDMLLKEKDKLGVEVKAVNVDHGIRGETSERDSLFVKNLCERLSVPLYYEKVDCPKFSNENGLSPEEGARILRYWVFARAIESGFCDKIATAHHASDRAETILFNLFRGTSPLGAGGIGETGRGGKIIRPMLSLSREEIDEYADKNKLGYVTDETNFETDYTRNFLRLNVIPLIKERFPEAEKSILRFADTVMCDDEYLTKLAESAIRVKNDEISFDENLPKPIFLRVAIIAMKKLGIKKDYEKIHAEISYGLKNLENGKEVSLPKGIFAVREYGRIVFYKKTETEPFEKPFKVGKYDFCGKTYSFELAEKQSDEDLKIRDNRLIGDFSKIPEGAVLRTKRAGDMFTKFGGGTKKLKDYLIDKKIPKRNRDKLLLLAKDEKILIICGIEISDLIRVDKSTSNVLQCYISDNLNKG